MGQLARSIRSQLAQIDLADRLNRLIEVERGRFALWLPVVMGAGIVGYYQLLNEPPAWIGGAVAVIAFAAAALAGAAAIVLRAALIVVGSAALGLTAAQFSTRAALRVEVVPVRGATITGTVRAIELLPEGQRLTLVAARFADQPAPLARMLRVRLRPSDWLVAEVGDTVRLNALVKPPAPPAYPGAWDLQRDAFYAGYAGYGFALGPAEVVERGAPSGFAQSARWLRDSIDRRIAAVLPGATGAIAATLLTGVTTAIPAPDREAFRDSGLAHILAVAGLHVGIVMGLAMGLARLVLALSEHASLHWPAKAVAAGFALAAGGFYLILTGSHVPIMRSFAMACLFTLAVIAGRRAASLRGLAVAAAALMLLAPEQVMGVSFQMSFSAVLALIVGHALARPHLLRLRAGGGGLSAHIAALALTSLLAGAASAPFGMYHFGRFQVYFVVSNLAAVPLTAFFVMPAGLIALALMPFGLDVPALRAMGLGVDGLIWIARATAALPDAAIAVAPMPSWGIVVLALGMAWAGLWRSRMRLAGLPLIAIGLASPAWFRMPDVLVAADGRLAGAVTPAGLFVQRQTGASNFTLDAWRQLAAAEVARSFPESSDVAEAGLACEQRGCLLRPRGQGTPAILIAHGSPRAEMCRHAGLVVAIDIARAPCHGSVTAISRAQLAESGAIAVWAERSGLRMLTDREVRGDRPWVLPAPQRIEPHRLPLADPETLPSE